MEVDYLINFFFLGKKFVKKENIGNIHTKKKKKQTTVTNRKGGEGKKPTVYHKHHANGRVTVSLKKSQQKK